MIEETYLIILSVIIVILVIALIVLTYKVFDLQHAASNEKRADVQGDSQAQTSNDNRENLHPEQHTAEPKKVTIPDINLTEDASDIDESMKRYTRKYSLDSVTLASRDGLSIASSHSDSDKEAANLAARYQENAIQEIGDTHIIPLNYRGEDILILFRTTEQIGKERQDMMIRDGRAVLAHWL